MSLEMKSVHVRLDEDAFDALRVVSEARDMDLGEAARVILTEALLGRVYSLRKALNGLNDPNKVR
jgi:hypothetical protein